MSPRRTSPLRARWLRRLSEAPISAKLCIAPGIILCIFLALGGLSYRNLLDSQHRLRDLSEGTLQTFRLVFNADDLTDTFHTELLRTLSIAATESDRGRVAPKVATARQAKERMLAAFDDLAQHPDAGLSAFAKIRRDLDVYSAAADIVLGVVETDPASASIFMAATEHSYDRLAARLDELRQEADQLHRSELGHAIDAASTASMLFLASLVLAVLSSAVVTAFAARAIARPIEEELRQSARHLAHAQRVAATGSLEVDLATGQIRGSAEMYRILGETQEALALTVEKVLDAVHPEDRERVGAYFAARRSEAVRSSLDFRIVRSDGAVRWVTSETDVVVDESRQPVSVVHAVKDVTDLLAAEAREREAKARFDAIRRRLDQAIDTMDHGFALFDRDRNLILKNSRYVEVRGPGHEFEIEPGRWIKHDESITATGDVVHVQTDLSSLKQHELALAATQISLESANRAKTDFLAHMSHELRTPLNAIIGFSEMIASALVGPLSARYRDYATDVNVSGKHLLEIINDILDLSKVEAGRLELQEATVSLAAVVEACRRMVTERADAAGVALKIHPADLIMQADELRLKQVLLNLLSNAIKFTPKGGLVTVATTVTAAGEIAISVADTGIGMRPEDIPRALEPFGQVDDAGKAPREGTGLGLPLAVCLTELHQGRLSVESAPGRGTTVTVILPAERARFAAGADRAKVVAGEVETSARVVPIAAGRSKPRRTSP
ncbi:MAG TPA: ATP-binding protein [Stellaceae bacterium]|nr:ATP-binding protein [Stellaceae bacterium]